MLESHSVIVKKFSQSRVIVMAAMIVGSKAVLSDFFAADRITPASISKPESAATPSPTNQIVADPWPPPIAPSPRKRIAKATSVVAHPAKVIFADGMDTDIEWLAERCLATLNCGRIGFIHNLLQINRVGMGGVHEQDGFGGGFSVVR